MRWQTEHVIAAPLARVEAVALDPDLAREMPRYIKAIEHVELLERTERDGVIERVIRYRPVFNPPPFAKGVTREMAEWLERTRWDLATHACTYVIEPNIPAQWRARFRGEGVYRLEARGADKTARIVEGDVVIDAPLVGRLAERFTIGRVKQQFDGEAELLAARV